MSVQTTNPKHQRKSPKEVFGEQMSLALAGYYKAEQSERIKAGIARRKAAQNDGKRNTNRSR